MPHWNGLPPGEWTARLSPAWPVILPASCMSASMRRDCRVTTSRWEVHGTSFRGQRWSNARHGALTRSVSARSRKPRPSRARRYGAQWPPRAPRTEIVDTVGAGDALTAALLVGILAGRSLDEVNERANAVAAYVCSQPGATPPIHFFQ